MTFTITVDVPRHRAVKMLTTGLSSGMEITSRTAIQEAIQFHTSEYGQLVWPELRRLRPGPEELARLEQEADALFQQHWPDFY